MKLLIASNNKHKIEEISEILAGKFDEILCLSQAGIKCDPEETSSTFLENALIKANEVAKIRRANVADGCPKETDAEACRQKASKSAQTAENFAILADDTGLCVDALGGAPGIFSARYADENGKTHSDEANRTRLLRELKAVCDKTANNTLDPRENELRKAHFECVVVLRYPNGKTLSAVGRVDGHILEKETGENGFGYDSLFFCDELGKTFAEASAEEKNSVSHRGRALQNLLETM